MHPFESKLAAGWLPEVWRDVTVLIAVSGGPDSVALLRALVAIQRRENSDGRLVVAHFNHQLRGASSDGDEAFVRELSRSLELACHVGRGSVQERAAECGDGIEAAARETRYEFLTSTAGQVGARYVVKGHTADDQAETILHRIVRGTGVAGLAGMPRVRALSPATTLLRPLLDFRRAEIIAYLNDLGQEFRIDATNVDPSLTRSRLRHDLLPRLAADYNPQVVDALLRLGTLAGEAQSIIDACTAELFDRHAVIRNDRVEMDCRQLSAEPRYLVRELFAKIWREQRWPLQAMGFAQWDELATLALAHHDIPRQMFPGPIIVERHGDRLVFNR